MCGVRSILVLPTTSGRRGLRVKVRRCWATDAEAHTATTTHHTEDAKHLVGDLVSRAGKTFRGVRRGDGFGGSRSLRVTSDDVAAFFATQAQNPAYGCRTLAGVTGDGRSVSELAQTCLDWLKDVNVAGMRRAARLAQATFDFLDMTPTCQPSPPYRSTTAPRSTG